MVDPDISSAYWDSRMTQVDAGLLALVFGNLVENVMVSLDNPTRYGYFVRRVVREGKMNPGTFAEITDARGKFWTSDWKNLNKISGRELAALRIPPPPEGGVRAALESAREEIVLAIAFLGRDNGTDRIYRTADELGTRLAKADVAIRAALSTPLPTAGREEIAKLIDAIDRCGARLKRMADDDAPPILYKREADLIAMRVEKLRDALATPTPSAEPVAGPNFELAARALGFAQFANGKWYSPTPSPHMNSATTFDTAEQIFDWWGRANGPSAEPVAWREGIDLLREVQGYAQANTDAVRTQDEQDTWRAHWRNVTRAVDLLSMVAVQSPASPSLVSDTSREALSKPESNVDVLPDGRCVPAISDKALWTLACTLHSNVPEDMRPMSWSDYSPEQVQRLRQAALAFLAALSPSFTNSGGAK